jgi:hypothetical protein
MEISISITSSLLKTLGSLRAKLSNFYCFSSALHPRLSDSSVGKSDWQSKEQLNELHSEIKSDLYVLELILYFGIAGEQISGNLDHLGEVYSRHWGNFVRQHLVVVPKKKFMFVKRRLICSIC